MSGLVTRRTLIKGAAALAAYTALTKPAAATTGIIAGALRWDAYAVYAGNSQQSQQSLAPSRWQFRAPWYASIYSNNLLECNETQANMDAECVYGAASGLKYWAFGWYGPIASGGGALNDPNFTVAWNLYQSSPNKNLINWCGLIIPSQIGYAPWSDTARWQENVNQWVGYFQQSNYQKVLGSRPLFYINWRDGDVDGFFGGNIANVATTISYMRSQCAAAGIGNPYIVVLDYYSIAPLRAASIGADAISGYTINVTYNVLPETSADLTSQCQTYWAEQVGTGSDTIPIVMTGWDQRPRIQNPESFASSLMGVGQLLRYGVPPPSDVATTFQDAINFIVANSANCTSKAILAYSWNECTEGGNVLCPTIGDPPVSAPYWTNMGAAVGPVLKAAA